jgi:hypothetical protein
MQRQKDGWIDGQTGSRRMDGQTVRRTGSLRPSELAAARRTDGRTDRQVDGWIDGRKGREPEAQRTVSGATSSMILLPYSPRTRMRPMAALSPMRLPAGGRPRLALLACRSLQDTCQSVSQ